MSEQSAESTVPRGRMNTVVMAAALALAAIAVIGVVLVFRFVDSQKQRDLHAWQVRLGIVADTRAADVTRWLDEQFSTLSALAENASLQLYMTELMLENGDDFDGEPAELSYLRNLLVDTAQRAGFTAPDAMIEIPANVERVGLAGIALTDLQGNLVVATPTMTPPNARVRAAMARAIGGEAALVDMYLGASQEPTMGFVVPIYAIQADRGSSAAIGLVIGLKLVGDDLYDRLDQPGETAETVATFLVRVSDTTVEYLSPLADGTPPLRRSLALDTADLASAFVARSPGGFRAARDYKGDEVLVTGRALSVAPWFLVRVVSSAEAMTEIDNRARTVLVVFILIIVGVSIALVAVWRHGTSLRATEAAERYRRAAEQFRNVTAFLRVVTDGQPHPIMAVDGDGQFMFVNNAAASPTALHPRDIVGKPMASVIGPVKARIFQAINNRVMADQVTVSEIHRFEEDDGLHIVKADHLPLPATSQRPAGVLMLLDDITELYDERERRERIMRQLVQTLVGVVDRRDPFSAHHSERVAQVSRSIATEMELSELDVETVDIAGSLINFGKILVPVELLTKMENLTDEERATLRDSVTASADLLEGVEFDGPVVAVIRQLREHWDGTGARGLQGDGIEVGARVVAVANAFVGMVSARAYRTAMPIDEACVILTEAAGAIFDRRPVSALINYLDNRGGRGEWQNFGAPPEQPEDGAS